MLLPKYKVLVPSFVVHQPSTQLYHVEGPSFALLRFLVIKLEWTLLATSYALAILLDPWSKLIVQEFELEDWVRCAVARVHMNFSIALNR